MKRLLLLPLSFALYGCPGHIMPKTDVRWYAGSSADEALVRKQDNPPSIIKAVSPSFDKMAGISYEDLSCLYQQLILNCEKWKDPNPACEHIPSEIVREALESGVN
jgi:hypothetical protein